MQIDAMRSSLTLPDDLIQEIERTATAMKESQATVLRLAIQAGLPVIGEKATRPYDSHMYDDLDQERIDLENATAKWAAGPDAGRDANENPPVRALESPSFGIQHRPLVSKHKRAGTL